MKKLFELIFLLFIFCMVVTYRTEIHFFIVDNFLHNREAFVSIPNEYKLDYSFNHVSTTDDFVATTPQQVLNIFYTFLNNGEEEFYFYCDYPECTKDINVFSNQHQFININNFVHPYNTYNKLYISSNSWGKVTVKVVKTYSDDEINNTNKNINQIMNKIIKDDMTDKEKIKEFHDYIINNTKYDIEYINNGYNDINYPSHKATGPLLYNKALCGGYAHIMSVFLDILKIPNYRISSDTHIWNLVYLDGKWYHLDLTWDDPVTSNKTDILLDQYFLIDTNTLESFNTGIHTYDKNIYSETIQTNQE